MSKNSTLHGVASFAVLIGLLGMAPGNDADAGTAIGRDINEPQPGGTLRYAVSLDVAGWKTNEINGTLTGADRGALIYDTLLLLGPGRTVEPNIAEQISSADGITWTMRLRPGVKFTDGTDLNADAVIFNIEYLLDPDNAFTPTNYLGGIEAMRALDALTVEFVLGEPNGNFPEVFALRPGMMMSPTALRADPTRFSTEPVGAGPFVLESWQRDRVAVFVRNPDYWNVPKPYLDSVEVRVIPDTLTQAQALLAGEVELIPLTATAFAATQDDTTLTTFPLHGDGVNVLVPNQAQPPFDDIRIRQAIALAIDPEVANEAVLQGLWEEPGYACPPYTADAPECIVGTYPTYDPDRATELVEEYVNDGNELDTYTLVTPASSTPALAEYEQQVLSDIGLDIEVRTLPVPEFVTAMGDGAYDIISTFFPGNAGNAALLHVNMHSEERDLSHAPVDPALDDALERALWAVDRDDRVAGAREAIEIIYDTFMITFVAPEPYGMIGSANVHFGDYLNDAGLVAQDVWLEQ